MIYRLNADLNGIDSISDVVAAGLVKDLPIRSNPEFEKAHDALLKALKPDDVVILDTISSLATQIIGDLKLGDDPTVSIWDQRKSFYADKAFMNYYNAVVYAIMRKLKNFRAVCDGKVRLITLAHEKDVRDEDALIAMRSPQIPPALLDSLKGSCTDMFRLTKLGVPMTKSDGTVLAPQGSRILVLEGGDTSITKYQVTAAYAEKIPEMMRAPLGEPTITKLYSVLGKKPSWLALYGRPGVGKTTFAVGEAYAQLQAQMKKAEVEA